MGGKHADCVPKVAGNAPSYHPENT
jgi:hypothetical protein